MKIKKIKIYIWEDQYTGNYFTTISWVGKKTDTTVKELGEIAKEITRIAYPKIKLVKYLNVFFQPAGMARREITVRYKVHNAHQQMNGQVQIAKEIEMMELKR